MRQIICGLIIIGCVFVSSSASAGFTTWFPSPNEPDLDEILDNLYGLSNVVRVADTGGLTDQIWFNSNAAVSVEAKFSSRDHTFGYYQGLTGWSFNPLFTVSGSGYLSGVTGGFTPAQSGNPFRFADKTGWVPAWSSLELQNLDFMDHMVTYQITGDDPTKSNTVGSYVLAWEDGSWFGDRDYNDLIVEVSGVGLGGCSPVPEPATLTLLGMGLVGFTGWSLRRRKK
ncbi:MAG: PEP-CTERM sorting domain-containing protein [Candidatus Eisenbacteria bacterium]|uniref:PEP-CTERM sorting domain-containing protein n=1 Tax=Eiseniibacteriota bacterium TaxID=2212470 RepID=A0A948W4S5_UNCEI|nr:PEP-CTERM sorting domain-containing protein [Candidatus Eisenbacteria bacterium]MBU1949630.1 PEP-CTERM sorting domain-containing protein [Candidatus Eisenbacteria bacterium]MBU2692542.1 PEP-CTERM sorting domain-containing protein [Candidatus Eisenbacteria bacterium]